MLQNTETILIKLFLPDQFTFSQMQILNLKATVNTFCLRFLNKVVRFIEKAHCVESVRIQSYSGSYFPAFGLNAGKLGLE